MSKEALTSNIIELLQNGENITKIFLEILHTDEIKNFKNNNPCYILHGHNCYDYFPGYFSRNKNLSSDEEEHYSRGYLKTKEIDYYNSEFNENFINFMTEKYPEKGFDLIEIKKDSEEKNNIESENNEKEYVRKYNPLSNYKTRMDYIDYLYEYGKQLLKDDKNKSSIENNFKSILDYGIKMCGYKNLTYTEISVNKFVIPKENYEQEKIIDHIQEDESDLEYYFTELITIE